jgi:hypothetical protein
MYPVLNESVIRTTNLNNTSEEKLRLTRWQITFKDKYCHWDPNKQRCSIFNSDRK